MTHFIQILAALIALTTAAQAQWWIPILPPIQSSGLPGAWCVEDADCNSGFCVEKLDGSGSVCTQVNAWTDCSMMGPEWAPMTFKVDGQGYLLCAEQPQPAWQSSCDEYECDPGQLCDSNTDCATGFCYAHPAFEAWAPLGTLGICVDYAERRIPRDHEMLYFHHVDPFHLSVPR